MKRVDPIYVTYTVTTSFPGLQCEDEARHEEALVWAGHVTTKNGSIWQLLVKEWRDIL
jgi:hypothetical protein